jgi:hypothetical protein
MVRIFIGCCLWYARMTDSPILTAVSNLATELPDRKRSILLMMDRILRQQNPLPRLRHAVHCFW